MQSKKEAPQNTVFIRKQSPIRNTTNHIEYMLGRFPEVQLRCGGTAVEQGILIAENAVRQGKIISQVGVAQYARFTSQLVPLQEREIVYTIIKLRRPGNIKKQERKPLPQQHKQTQNPTNQSRRQQESNQNYKGNQNYSRNQGYNERNYRKQGEQSRQQYREPQRQYRQSDRRQQYREPERQTRPYNEQHRERNQRRQGQKYSRQGNQNRGQKGYNNQPSRKDRDYR